MNTHSFIGDVLLRSGVIDEAGLVRAIDAQAKRPSTIGRALADLGLAEESVVARAVAASLHLEYYDGEPPAANAQLDALLPAEFCKARSAFPLSLEGNRLRVAVSDPLDVALSQDMEFRTGKKIVAVVVTQGWLEKVSRPDGPETLAR